MYWIWIDIIHIYVFVAEKIFNNYGLFWTCRLGMKNIPIFTAYIRGLMVCMLYNKYQNLIVEQN